MDIDYEVLNQSLSALDPDEHDSDSEETMFVVFSAAQTPEESSSEDESIEEEPVDRPGR